VEKIKLNPSQENKDQRIDLYLVEAFDKKYSRSYIQNLIKDKLVLINNKKVKAHYTLKGNEQIQVSLPVKKETKPAARDIPLDIVYEDCYLAVINKPSGIIVHPVRGNRPRVFATGSKQSISNGVHPASGNFTHTLINALLYHIDHLSDVAGPLKPGIVHRLDKETSGLLVIAKDNETHKKLASQFKQRSVKRQYQALVHGVVQLDRGLIEAPVGRSLTNRKKMDVNYLSKKDAKTYYEVEERFKKATLLKLNLETGRTHQIRIHLRHIGYPLIGDSKYGLRKDAPRQMLHAAKLGFIHPATGEYTEFKSKIPQKMKEYIDNLRNKT
jgi:23S rRNA pseudouridine1911/1915/1917 synthase